MLWPCTLAVVLGAANPHFEPALKLVKELNYPEAASVLAKARAHPGNDRQTLTQLLWLQGMVAATLGKSDDARGFFRLLCSIDPDFMVKGDPPPKVMGPFFEAKGWATTMGKLKFEALPPEVKQGAIAAVAVAVTDDPLKLARRIRFRLKGTGASWYTVDATLAEPKATIAWAATELSWWAELLGEHDAVLATAGTESSPIVLRTKSEAVAAPAPVVVTKDTRFFGPLRFTGLAATVAGIGCAVAGGIFASNAGAGAAKIRSASRDSAGTITGLSQREAFAIDERAKSDSTIAAGLFAGAGVVTVGGVLLFAFGAP